MANSDVKKIDFESSRNHSQAWLEYDKGGPPIFTWANFKDLAGVLFGLYALASVGSMALDMEYIPWLHGWLNILPWLKSFLG